MPEIASRSSDKTAGIRLSVTLLTSPFEWSGEAAR
jgi:hypothetical protein